MLQITNLSDSPDQQTTLLLADNSSVVLTFRFLPAVQRWVFDVAYGSFSLRGIGLSLHPNLLRAYRQRVPFGLACVAVDPVDPFDINDFQNDRVQLYVLDSTGGQTEVEEVEASHFS